MVPQHAHTPEEINAEWLRMFQSTEFDFDLEIYDVMARALTEGKSLCDENGFILPEYRYMPTYFEENEV